MVRNLFDLNIASSTTKFLSGSVASATASNSLDDSSASLSSARSTASSSADSHAQPVADDSMEALSSNGSHRSRANDHSARGDRKPMTFTTTSSITGTNTTTIVAGGQTHQQLAGHVHNANAAAESKASKKCSVCGKSFNPLRRRHYCRTCTAVVCSSCSISRKVESTFEGAITVRMCVSCKLSSIASQDDFYDRIFSTNGGSNTGGGTTDSQPSGSEGDFSTDRLSFASYSSGTAKDDMAVGATSSSMVDMQPPMDKRTASASNLPVRRKSSTTSGNDGAPGARGRHGSFTGPPAVTEDCPWCMNEACAPLHEYFEVPYPFFLELADPAAKNQYIAAKHLDNEKERLRSVRTIRGALKAGTSAAQTVQQLCNMAAIATSSPMSLVGLLDKHVYVPCAETGLGSLDKIDRQKSLAAHACRNGSPLVCSDLTRDVRFAANPWRRDVLQAQFYAGIPLTLSNGHTIGAIEVFDVTPRFACMDVISQLQTVVRGLLRKFEEILAKNPGSTEEDVPHKSSSSSGRRTPKSENGDGKQRTPRAPAPNAPAPPAIPPPKKSPKKSPKTSRSAGVPNHKPSGPAPQPPKPAAPKEAPKAPEPAPAEVPAPAPAPAPEAAAPAAGAEPTQEQMEMRLMQLLSQTTSTQEQLRNQQGQMVSAISSHSKQINDLAKQLERMESTLAAKLGMEMDDDEDSPSKEDADAASA
ncbi:1-phosphatidylinositol 3-phosphate 5-kinase FAB1 [Phytophthora cinnamomi]|uniref:1-phosphatidylinositol 3-phosphate 5-kinase FAB1 n=1 Tax=Phytophthora cinnamomi TaxID=4785 RepID=UPI003559A423|nr:1-phosphatidylinositol 3-phosphate 5-kinase FAB1 [Phytophthora cinnamomi]